MRQGFRCSKPTSPTSALARNRGVAAATGRFVAFLDGDDLWGPNWLVAAYQAAMAGSPAVVWHPEACLYFGPGHEPHWLLHPDIETIEGDWVTLGMRNQWTSLSFAPRDTYLRVPYPRNDLAAGFGTEDWCWNSEVVAQGYLHKPVPGTAHLIRVRTNSLVKRTIAANALMTPSTLLRSRIGWALRVGSIELWPRTRSSKPVCAGIRRQRVRGQTCARYRRRRLHRKPSDRDTGESRRPGDRDGALQLRIVDRATFHFCQRICVTD